MRGYFEVIWCMMRTPPECSGGSQEMKGGATTQEQSGGGQASGAAELVVHALGLQRALDERAGLESGRRPFVQPYR